MDTVAVERRRYAISGIVQGVGFRPLVYRLALEHKLRGWVCNQLGIVTIDVEGHPDQVAHFRSELLTLAQAPARIDQVDQECLDPAGHQGFCIKPSTAAGRSAPAFPPDLAACPACLADTVDPTQRFNRYPFTSCTYCGPRYAIIQALPYDRPATSMSPFPMCDTCWTEYTAPLDRRFHAQTIACPRCGPRIEARTNQDIPIPGDWCHTTQQALLSGEIAAVKGTGGVHLLCDAAQEAAVQHLRERKHRPRRPFAVMVRDLQTVIQHFDLSQPEQEALTSKRAPILLLKPKPILSKLLPLDSLAPGHQRVGVMLPYSPLHHMLFLDQMRFLVTTSGNSSGFPIAKTNEEAYAHLGQIADLFLLNDREIVVRVEDSVCQVVDQTVILLRRSRGFVPESIAVPLPPSQSADLPIVLATGAEQKNTFCLLRANQAIVSQHNGDIDSKEHLACWHDGIRHMTSLLGVEPEVVAYDPHPGYLVSEEAIRHFAGKTVVPVFHHHAHMAACMAEHGLTGPVIGCILDGTGFGPDGSLWGFEILTGDYAQFERVAHLAPFTLPGGEASIRQPWLLAVSLFHQVTGNSSQTAAWANEFFPAYLDQIPLVVAQLDGRIPAPKASSAGRLFDAVSAMLGICTVATYDGEAAELLGECAETDPDPTEVLQAYPTQCDHGVLQIQPLVNRLVDDLRTRVPNAIIARKFHRCIAEMVCLGALQARQQTRLQSVVLGGGVWSNRYLLPMAEALLTRNGFQVYAPSKVPAGDGGIALGQALSALWRCQQNVSCSPGSGS